MNISYHRLILKGYKCTMTFADMLDLRKGYTCQELIKQFNQKWHQYDKNRKCFSSLILTLIYICRSNMIITGVFCLVYTFGWFLNPMMLRYNIHVMMYIYNLKQYSSMDLGWITKIIFRTVYDFVH